MQHATEERSYNQLASYIMQLSLWKDCTLDSREYKGRLSVTEVRPLNSNEEEISSILNELRRTQKQLEMINSIVEPGGAGSGNPKVAAVAAATSAGQATRSPSRQKKAPSKPTGPGDRQRCASPSTSPTTSKPNTNANESTKRSTRGLKGANFMA